MPFQEIKAQVEKELGQSRSIKFLPPLMNNPLPQPPLAKCHKATLPKGEQVVVKVQYPGVEEACESDLKQVRLH